MDVYYYVIFFTLLLGYSLKVSENDKQSYFIKIVLCFVPIFLFGALRENFGIDYEGYLDDYNRLHGRPQLVNSSAHAEVGYQWLNVIMPTWRSLVVLVSTAIIFAYGFLYYKYVEPKMLLLALFFTMFYPERAFFMSFVAMRNGLAVAGSFLCLPLIINRKYWLLIPIAIGLAFLHKSAIIFILLSMIVGQNFTISKKEIYGLIGIVVLLSVSTKSDLINLLLPLMEGEQMDSYKEYYMVTDDHSSLLSCSVNIIMIYCLVSWGYSRRNELMPMQNVFLRLSILYLLSPFLGVLGRTRMLHYYLPYFIITTTYIMGDKWQDSWKKLVYISLAIAIMFYATFIVWMGNPWFVYEHYQSIFSD